MLIEALQKQSGLGRKRLIWFAQTASRRYKVYNIPKRAGGVRRIEHPSRELKAIQRWINKFLFRSFPIHENAMAYKKGAKILLNAERHVNTSFTLRLDFEDFFPSFSSVAIARYLDAQNTAHDLGLSKEDISFVCQLVTRNGTLTVGSPASPVITNVMMFDFDDRISGFVHQNRLIYTRYADDLFISSRDPNLLQGVAKEIADVARNYEHVRLRINKTKTAYLSRRYKRSITGLIITPDQKVSIGRDRKREIKSLVHRYLNGQLNAENLSRLQGLVAFAMDAEISFYNSLRNKYGQAVLEKILGRAK